MNAIKVITRYLVVVLSLAAVSSPAASEGGPKIGDLPPLLQATSLLAAPPGSQFDQPSLRGKVVVLEFWATWCGPCVAAIPHLNELADHFKGQPVQFIAITAEPAGTIEPFIQRRPINAWIALDTNRAMNKAYGVGGIPHTVVLDTNGVIAAITYPTMLTAQAIQDLLDGKKISLPETRSDRNSNQSNEKTQAAPLFELSVRPSQETNVSSYGGGGRFTARGCTVKDLLPRAFNLPGGCSDRLVNQASLPTNRFDFTVIQTVGPGTEANALDENVSSLLQQLLSSTFGIHGRKETREVDVLLLKVKSTHAPGLVVSPTAGFSCRTGSGVIEGTDVPISLVVAGIESSLKQPVFDETGLTNCYDLSLKWDQPDGDRPDSENLRKVLADQCGLELVAARRPVEMVIIEGPQKEPVAAGK